MGSELDVCARPPLFTSRRLFFFAPRPRILHAPASQMRALRPTPVPTRVCAPRVACARAPVRTPGRRCVKKKIGDTRAAARLVRPVH
jgi:hypothetical protein